MHNYYKIVCLSIFFFLISNITLSQTCGQRGQTPSSAFPVCATQTFEQSKVPFCQTGGIPGPRCFSPGDGPHTDQNPFWYKFTCYKGGTLGFKITPQDLGDDYDWQVFDITGRNPNDIFTDINLYVTMNWSGEPGVTGASSAGTSLDVCGGWSQPLFSKMAEIKEGHEYLLLISHFTTESQSGYKLEFGGGTAIINDPNLPSVTDAGYECGPIAVGVKLSRKINCTSIAANGSDFTFTTSVTSKITSAIGIGCTNSFDTDSLLLMLDKPLPAGTYTIVSKKGTDGNTLVGNCDVTLPEGEMATFNVTPTFPVAMGKVSALPCAPDQIQLIFEAPVRCASIASSGKDFVINGPTPVKITNASGNCNSSGLTSTITLTLSQRILAAGNYTVTLVQGDDGNTIESECHLQTPAGGTAPFNIPVQPTVNLRQIAAVSCSPSTLKLGLSIPVRCNTIAADGSDFQISGSQAIKITGASGICNNGMSDTVVLQLSGQIQKGGNYTVTLRRGTDNNTLISECWQEAVLPQQATVIAADTVNARFTYSIDQQCKISTIRFSHDGRNNVNNWQWQFDDGETSSQQFFQKVYTSLGVKHFALKVSNGVCEASASLDTLLRSEVTALFDVNPGPYCPMDVVKPANQSLGNIISYLWEYGNGAVSKSATPVAMQYIPSQKEQLYRIRLIVKNDANCSDTADHFITAVSSCYIDVPTAFSPNNDGQNDYLYPLNAYKALDLTFTIYNRAGNLLFKTNNWKVKWDGTVNGEKADIGTYVWVLEYTESVSGKKVFRKGTTVLLR